MKATKRLFLVACALLTATCFVDAKFGLDSLDINGIGKKIKKATDTAKDVAKMGKGVLGIGPEEEHLIGGSVAVEIISRNGGLLKDKMAVKRVNLVGKALARYSDRPELGWVFGILDSTQVNAFSAPSGYVFITKGLYELCETDDQLAAVLAHEITHITKRHALSIVGRSEFLAGATNIASRQSSDVRRVQATLEEFDLGINKIISKLCENGFDPATEFEADKGGDALCSLCGYKQGSLNEVLCIVRDNSKAKEKRFSTHPPIEKRIAKLPAP